MLKNFYKGFNFKPGESILLIMHGHHLSNCGLQHVRLKQNIRNNIKNKKSTMKKLIKRAQFKTLLTKEISINLKTSQ